MKPVIKSKNVVLPAPFGPIKLIILFFSKFKFSISTAFNPPKLFFRFLISIMLFDI